MNIPFFESHPGIVRELSTMDHHTKEYKKFLQKTLLEIGGPVQLLNHLKTTATGESLRRKYRLHVVFAAILLILMFIWLLIVALVTGDKEIAQFSNTEVSIFAGFIAFEVITVFFALFFAFRAKNILLLGVSYLADNYLQQRGDAASQTLSEYKFPVARNNRIAIIVSIVAFATVFTITSLSGGLFDQLFRAKAQEFSKSGLSITLTQDFHEQDVVSQTATYLSDQHIVICLKEEFAVLLQNGMLSDITLAEYAEAVIANNKIDTTLSGDAAKPQFTYTRQINGKDFSYRTMVFKGSDAFWTVTFACETSSFASSQDEFETWSNSIKVS